jgi:hypothetical protein
MRYGAEPAPHTTSAAANNRGAHTGGGSQARQRVVGDPGESCVKRLLRA